MWEELVYSYLVMLFFFNDLLLCRQKKDYLLLDGPELEDQCQSVFQIDSHQSTVILHSIIFL